MTSSKQSAPNICKCKEPKDVFNAVCGKCLNPLYGAVHSEGGLLIKNPTKQKQRIENEPDYINHPKHKNSLASLLESHPEGVSDEEIARVLMCSISDVEKIYNQAILKLRAKMKVDVNIE